MRALEALVFVGLASALHAAAFVVTAPDGGAPEVSQAAPAVSLAAMPAALAEAWMQAPQAADAPPSPDAPRPDALPDLAAHTDTAPANARPQALADSARADALPRPVLPPEPPTARALHAALPVPRPVDRPRSLPDPAPAPRPTVLKPQNPLASQPDAAFAPVPDGIAPAQSLRPSARPDTLAQKPARAPDRQAKPRKTGKAQAKSTASAPKKTQRAATGTGDTRKLQAEWGARIQAAVARAQQYPSNSRATGTVRLRLTVSPAGRLSGVSIRQSSGDAALDRAALRAAQRARLPKAPGGLSAAAYPFDLALRFTR